MANEVKTEATTRAKTVGREDARIEVSQNQKSEDTLIAKLGRRFINRYRKDLEALARK